MKRKKGQSILEYVIILSAIVAAVIAVGRFVVREQTDRMFYDLGESMDAQTNIFRQQAAGGMGSVGN